MFGELRDDHLSKQARSSDTAAYGTWRRLGGDRTVAAVGTGILGQDVDMKFKVGGDELQHTGTRPRRCVPWVLALQAKLLGLGYIMLDAHLR